MTQGRSLGRPITRRRFLGGVSLMVAGAALEACARPSTSLTPAPSAGVAGSPGASPAASPAAEALGTTILRNASVLTMDPAKQTADAVAISGDRIAAVGTEAEVMAATPDATVVDVGGRILMPGFNDAHCHRLGDLDVAGYPSIEAGIEAALAGGWTSVSELFVNQERLDALRRLDDADQLRLRVNCYLPVNYENDKFGIWFSDYQPSQVFSPNLRIGGVKVFADSAWTSGMYMTEPHTDQPGYLGDLYWTPEELTDLYRGLHDEGWQIATHTCGDGAHDLVLDAYEAALAGASNADHRHRIEHAMAVRDDQLQRMRDLAILASFQLTWFTPDTTPDVEGTLGPDRLAWVGRWRDFLDAGVPAVASTDYPWDDVTDEHDTGGLPMTSLAIAMTRKAAPDQVPEPWQAAQTISAEEGLGLMTSSGAYSTFEEDQKGTVSVGQLADLVVLSDDPRTVPPDQLGDVHALMTMVGGRMEYQDPGSTAFDALVQREP